MKFALLSLLLASCLASTFGAIMLYPLQIDLQYGKKVGYCEYEGVKFLKGTRFTTLGCVNCKCDKDGLHCSSSPPYQEANWDNIPPKKRCTMVSVKCKDRWVRESDTSRKCPKKWMRLMGL